MKIYDAEKSIAALLKNRSIAYLSPLEKPSVDESEIIRKSFASKFLDLSSKNILPGEFYPVNSILVSSVWNRNDDIFTPAEIYLAKNSPVGQPVNIEHDENRIIGHMIASLAVDQDGNKIADDIEISNLPELIHLVNRSVIYTHFQGERKEEVEEILEAIDKGEMYVSMEALFNDFDYGVLYPNGTKGVIPRTQTTAYLTKHLRIFGGRGIIDGVRIGRVLKNIRFVGKGFVYRPANPDSIIFSKEHDLCFSTSASENRVLQPIGVELIVHSSDINSEKNNMSEDILKTENSELKTQLKSAQSEIKTLSEKLSNINVEKLEAEIRDLESKLASATKLNEDLESKAQKLESEIETKSKELEDTKSSFSELKAQKLELEKSIESQKRVAELTEAGIDREDAQKTVAKFEELTSDQFAEIAKHIVEAAKMMKKKQQQEEMDDTECGESNAGEVDFSDADSNSDDQADLSVDASDSEAEDKVAARAKDIVSIVASYNKRNKESK